ncbi:MAG: DUF1499 domain-containing protein [Gammaproteobacteria bacterium]
MLVSIIGLVALITGVLLALSFFSKSHLAPGNPSSRFRPCPDTPNCVCSLDINRDSYILPVKLDGDMKPSTVDIKRVLVKMGGEIREEEGSYIWATFTSRVFRFVDDVEIMIDPASKVIQVRSASRAGRSDFGVNRARMEKLRSKLFQSTGRQIE